MGASYDRWADIFRSIESELSSRYEGRGQILAVNGVDTSGKTMFAQALADYLHEGEHAVELVHLDDFHNPRIVRRGGADEVESYFRNAFNLSLLEERILAPVSRGQLVERTLTLLDLDSDTFTNRRHYRIDCNTIVILEGVLLFREPLNHYFDYRVYLHIDFDEVLRRAEVRDVPKYGRAFLDRYKAKYLPLQQKYIFECAPLRQADLVIDNSDWDRPEVLNVRR